MSSGDPHIFSPNSQNSSEVEHVLTSLAYSHNSSSTVKNCEAGAFFLNKWFERPLQEQSL